ncbi:hypothetical protein EJB05_17010, partial [Eragrostis curvula]
METAERAAGGGRVARRPDPAVGGAQGADLAALELMVPLPSSCRTSAFCKDLDHPRRGGAERIDKSPLPLLFPQMAAVRLIRRQIRTTAALRWAIFLSFS